MCSNELIVTTVSYVMFWITGIYLILLLFRRHRKNINHVAEKLLLTVEIGEVFTYTTEGSQCKRCKKGYILSEMRYRKVKDNAYVSLTHIQRCSTCMFRSIALD